MALKVEDVGCEPRMHAVIRKIAKEMKSPLQIPDRDATLPTSGFYHSETFVALLTTKFVINCYNINRKLLNIHT